MKKALLALLLLLPLAGCAHGTGGYAGGAGYFYGDCLYPDDCYGGIYQPGYYYYDYYGIRTPRSVERARVTKVQRTASTRVVTRQAVPRPTAAGSASARSAPHASSARSAPAQSSHAGGRGR